MGMSWALYHYSMHLADTHWRISGEIFTRRYYRTTKTGSFSPFISSNEDNRNQIQGAEALCHPILPLRLLPLVGHLQQLRHLRRRLVVRREDVIHVLFEAVIVELSPLLDFAGHLFVDFFDV